MSEIKFTSSTENVGSMRCSTVYLDKLGDFITDVPIAIGGKGEFPTPGIMLASCVASCMLSMVSFKAQSKGVDPTGTSIRAAVEEGDHGISALHFEIFVPVPTTPEQRWVMEAAARACPVGNALRPEIEKHIRWSWA